MFNKLKNDKNKNIFLSILTMIVKLLGHSMVYVEAAGKKLIIDPWIEGNSKATVNMEDVRKMGLNYVLITHGHHDHGFEEGVVISKTGVKLVGTIELTQEAKRRGSGEVVPLNIGGYFKDGDLKIHMFPALHTCPYGVPVTFVISDGKSSIYHAGDTGVMKDFEIISKMYPTLNLAILPIGGRFTMSYEDMGVVKELLKAKRYVGVHYDTFPEIKIDKNKAREYIEIMDDVNIFKW